MVSTRRSTNKRKANKDTDIESKSQPKASTSAKKRKLTPDHEIDHDLKTESSKKGKQETTFKQEVATKQETSTKQEVTIKQESKQESLENFEDLEDSDDSDEENVDWEAVQFAPQFELRDLKDEEEDTEEDLPVYQDVEIVMEAPRPVLKKSHWERAYQRNLREWLHHSHVITLIAHYKIRNKWCSDKDMKSVCTSILPENAKRLLSKNNSTENSLKTGIKWLLKWWSGFFKLTGPGLLTVPYNDLVGHYRGHKNLKDWIDSHKSDEYGDYIGSLNDFKRLLKSKSGTRDTSSELFVALLRACGCTTRLVCSLQPVPYKIPPAASSDKKKQVEEEEEPNDSQEKPVFEYRANARAYVDPNVQLKLPKAKPPTVWAEVYASDTQRWMCVDPVRGIIDKPLLMEPPNLDRNTCLSFVLAFDKKGCATDVTRRYTANMEKAIKLRERPLTKREVEGGMKLWSDVLLQIVCHKSKLRERDVLEQHELENQKVKEVMPTSISGFKNHPLYALERHLLKFEIIYPKDLLLGSIRGERIYPRANVKTVASAETYKKTGRQIKHGEQPIKYVKANAFTIEKKRIKELAKQDGEEYLVPCYGEWQTEVYVPPPVVDGVLPKNSFGNIELFTSTMLPQGAAHIKIKGIGKLAKKLGIDYADAVVDFEFVKMRAVPIIEGIVVAEQSQKILLEAWEEHEQHEALKAITKQQKEVYARWRHLIKSLMIKARVDREYNKDKPEYNIENKWNNFKQEDDNKSQPLPEAGGFLEDEEDTGHDNKWAKFNEKSKLNTNNANINGGGFDLDDEDDEFY